MAESERYPIPGATVRVEDEIKGSRFTTTAAYAPASDAARAFIDGIRNEFPDATHNCWAYVVGAPGTTHNNGASDDGEPGGTAGRPMLSVLLGSPVGDVCAVVTRYFGGVKLGRGGLVRAYGGGVQHALREMVLSEHVPLVRLGVRVPYPLVDPVRRALEEHGARVVEELFTADVHFLIEIARDRRDAFVASVLDASSGSAKITDA